VQRVFAPAFLFWAGGFLCLVWRDGWERYVDWWAGLDSGQLLMVIVGGLLLVAISGAVARQMDNAMLRWLEGYWPHWPGVRQLRSALCRRQIRRIEEAEETLAALQRKGLDAWDAEALTRWNRADALLRHAPRDAGQVMPTALGNILRAAERRPRARFGLEVVDVWPRLWMLLPERARKDVGEAREGLNTGVRLVFWGLLFVLWSLVAWWAVIPGLLVALLAYRWTLTQAKIYGDLLEASFDLHRFDLYKALHWPLPQNTLDEKEAGERLTFYLHRGYLEPPVEFGHGD